MSDAAPAKGKLCLGHFVALAGLGLGLAVLIWQWIWALSVTKGAGPVINLVLQFLLLAVLLAACAAFVADGAGRRKTVAVSYALLGAAVSGFALVWHGLLAHTLNDVKAPLGNANLLGVFLILPIAMTVALAFREWRTRRRIFVVWLYALAGVLDIVVLGLCRSMSAWLGLFLYVGVLCLLKATKKARLALILVLACGASAGIFWLAGGFGHLYRTRTYLLRMGVWRRAAEMPTGWT